MTTTDVFINMAFIVAAGVIAPVIFDLLVITATNLIIITIFFITTIIIITTIIAIMTLTIIFATTLFELISALITIIIASVTIRSTI